MSQFVLASHGTWRSMSLLRSMVLVLSCTSLSWAGVATVTNTNDSGPGSLRQAILDVNADGTLTSIVFNIPAAGVQTITPLSPLPTINDPPVNGRVLPLLIDGYTQPGATPNTLADGDNANLLMEISGAQAGNGANGLTVGTGSVIIQGLVINRFASHGIVEQFNNVTIQGNFIGTNSAGTAGLGNGGDGVLITPNDAGFGLTEIIVGGQAPAARNVISGNIGFGIEMKGAMASSIQGNFIGTASNGTSALANSAGGVILEQGAGGNKIGGTVAGAGNVISGNLGPGLQLTDGGTDFTFVQGNYIGVDVTGTAPLGNGGSGLIVASGANESTIGGLDPTAANVISGNGGNGVLLSGTRGNHVQSNFIGTDFTGSSRIGNSGSGMVLDNAGENFIGGIFNGGNVISGNGSGGLTLNGFDSNTNTIQSNLIGVDATGAVALGNGGDGIILVGGANNNTIGGIFAFFERNIVSGNSLHGIEISGVNTNFNVVEGNDIGINALGAPLGNLGDGVRIGQGAFSNAIGVSAGNTIAFNAKGVVVTDSSTTAAIESNSIFSNLGLGIDLNDDGVTPNTPGGPHSGPNNLQNYPVLTSAVSTGGPNSITTVAGTLNSRPFASFHVGLFGNQTCDASGYGQGQNFLASSNVNTDSNGNASLYFTIATSLIGSGFFTTTATESGNNVTSEFSACREADYALTNVAGRNLRVRLGQPFTFVVASFTDNDPFGNAGQFSTTSIDWGDGTTGPAIIVSTGGQNYNVVGSHAYTKVGAWTVTVTINDSGGATATATSQVRLWPKPLSY